jgi:hypothetical protein
MADKTHRTKFELSAVDRATAVFKQVEGGLTGLHAKYVALGAVAATALGAGGVGAFLSDAIKYRSALDDLADTTGDNVRTLDGMARQARVSGLELDRFGGILTLVARNLNAADDEGTAAAQAIAAIGLSVSELRALSPADQMAAIAKAMNGYADGQGKIAVANALAKGSARELLPFLKDLAEAGELNGRLTAEQVAQADRLEKEWRKLRLAFEDSKESLATSLIPQLAKLIEQGREGIKVFGGFWSALYNVGWGIDPTKNPRENITEMQREVAALEANRDRRSGIAGFDPSMYNDRIAALNKRIEFSKFMERQNALELTGDQYLDARDLRARQKDTLNFVPQTGKDKATGPKALTAAEIAKMQAESLERFQEDVAKGQGEIYEDQKRFNDELMKSAEHYRDLIDPLRQYTRQWEELDRLLRLGAITPEEYLDAYVKVAEAADKARIEMEGVSEEGKKTKNAFAEMGFTATSALEDIILKGGEARDIIRALGQDLARILLRRTVLDPLAKGTGDWLDKLFSGDSGKASTGDFAAGGGFENVDWAGSFASGGSFTVGGRGGTDSQLVAFRASPGERVSVNTPGQGGMNLTYAPQIHVDARADRAQVMADVSRLLAASERRMVRTVQDLDRR